MKQPKVIFKRAFMSFFNIPLGYLPNAPVSVFVSYIQEDVVFLFVLLTPVLSGSCTSAIEKNVKT